MKSLPRSAGLLLPLLAGLAPLGQAQTTPAVTVAINAQNTIQDGIDRSTFGTGVEFHNVVFRDIMNTPTLAQTRLKEMKLGSMRFPHGTCGLHYLWDAPSQSYIANGAPPSLVLTPDLMRDYTEGNRLFMQKLFEVNTYAYRSSVDGSTQNIFNYNAQGQKVIDTQKLSAGADYAAAWVANDNSLPSNWQTYLWEIGNEDWAHWSPADYATIFNTYAERMRTVRPNIQLLAQSFTGSYTTLNGVTNSVTWLQQMIDAGISKNIHALSEHLYLDGGAFSGSPAYARRYWQTQNLQALIHNSWQVGYLRGTLDSNQMQATKIWITEMNLDQKDGNNNTETLQDMGHALVIADWVGKLLEQGAGRIYMHSMDHNPAYAQMQYFHEGRSVSDPAVNVPGYAFAKYAQEFGPRMVPVAYNGNPTLYSPDQGAYPQIAVYASVRNQPNDKTLRIMAINRGLESAADLTIQVNGSGYALRQSGNGQVQTLSALTPSGAADLLATNRGRPANQPDPVNWSAVQNVPMPTNATTFTRRLEKASATFLILPLQ